MDRGQDCADLRRRVYCVLGLPIDAIDMSAVISQIEAAAEGKMPLLIATPNTNFLIQSRRSREFRESILASDLCPPDGMPIVWISRLLGLPIKERVSGSDFFDVMRANASRLRVFFFGGAEGVADTAAKALTAAGSSLTCVGTLYPGFGSVDEMSRVEIINAINSSDADFLAVALGASKGQSWLQRNNHRLTVPVRVHLGAVLNFQAGTLKRAPRWLRRAGMEWLWRIKEEPYLWRRYWNDGRAFLMLLFSRIFPLALVARWDKIRVGWHVPDLVTKMRFSNETTTIYLDGPATEAQIDKLISCFQSVLEYKAKFNIINLSRANVVDLRFLGLLLLLQKELNKRGASLTVVEASSAVKRIFRLSELEYLVADR
jgi:N-acetylglucosaminyldiphosphoundecaprenol N-acetyl-beta-D-mannosaminyltransferase